MPKVNPEILIWARETAGLSRADAARKLQIRDAWGVKAADRLAALESGEAEPTRPTLVKMAKRYRRPLVAFYLSAPPEVDERRASFRALTAGLDPETSARVEALIRNVSARQSMVRAALEDEDDAEPIPFIGSGDMSDGRQSVIATLSALLSVTADDFHAQPNADRAFARLRADVEANGVFTMLKGDLGSHHTEIDAEAFRGFAIADEIAPFIVVNDRDSRAAWSFTLLHETVHLILGESGAKSDRSDAAVERFCDDVAGEFLLPSEVLVTLRIDGANESLDRIESRIDDFAHRRNLSRAMVAYRAHRANMIGPGAYATLRDTFRAQWRRRRDLQRQRNRGRDGGPNYYIVRRHRTGEALTNFARRMMESGSLSTARTARILGVKPTQVGYMLNCSLLPPRHSRESGNPEALRTPRRRPRALYGSAPKPSVSAVDKSLLP